MPARPIIALTKSNSKLSKIFLDFVKKSSQYFARPRFLMIKNHLKGKRILDIGLGMGSLAMNMKNDGYKVVGVDVDNTSLYQEIAPVIYDGKVMPFKNSDFDTATIICVLHHCSDQVQVLREAMRVAKRTVVIEDTHRNKFERNLVSFRDSFENWEWYYHNYRSYLEWKNLCDKEGWKVRHIKSWSSFDFGFLYGRQTLFVIDK